MSALTSSVVRSCARQQLRGSAPPCRHATAAAAVVARQHTRHASQSSPGPAGEPMSTFESPFRSAGDGADSQNTLRIPSFDKYRSRGGETRNKVFSYFMAGSMGALSAVGAKATVQDFLVNMSASADILALAKVEIDLSSIPEGKNVIIKWRGKPVFIRHRTEDEIKEAEQTKWESLRDPEPDSARVKKPEWLVMLGVCTHLGCVPIGEAGDYGGWFCPCHGSHYDISGRARKGPAPLNLEIPAYDFPSDTSLVIG